MYGFFNLPYNYMKDTQKFEITKTNKTNYKALVKFLLGKKQFCNAMYLITKETIYKEAQITMKEAVKSAKNVLKHGVCTYKAESKTDKHVIRFIKNYEIVKNMMIMLDIKMLPSKAESIVSDWLLRDAEEKAEIEEAKKKDACKPVLSRVSKEVYEISF